MIGGTGTSLVFGRNRSSTDVTAINKRQWLEKVLLAGKRERSPERKTFVDVSDGKETGQTL